MQDPVCGMTVDPQQAAGRFTTGSVRLLPTAWRSFALTRRSMWRHLTRPTGMHLWRGRYTPAPCTLSAPGQARHLPHVWDGP